MYREAKNLKPGDRVTWTFEFLFEVKALPEMDESGCRLTVELADAGSIRLGENATQTIAIPSPKTRLRYLGNMVDIEQQIRRLTEQKAKLQAGRLPAPRGRQAPPSPVVSTLGPER